MGLRLRTAARHLIFGFQVNRAKDLLRQLDSDQALRGLRDLWRNPSVPDVPYLREVFAHARTTKGAVLECGSGLTTAILAGLQVPTVSLEHDRYWWRVNRWRLRRLRLAADVRFAPLRSYGDFAWYEVPEDLPNFELVVCDGPPGGNYGGRYGLLPALQDRLAGAVVILDDVDRSGEQRLLRRWEHEFGAHIDIATFAEARSHAIVRLPAWKTDRSSP